jgi:hypothetical protein
MVVLLLLPVKERLTPVLLDQQPKIISHNPFNFPLTGIHLSWTSAKSRLKPVGFPFIAVLS